MAEGSLIPEGVGSKARSFALLRTTKNEAPAKGRERVVILNEVKDLAPKAVQIQSRDPSGEKHAVRMTGQR